MAETLLRILRRLLSPRPHYIPYDSIGMIDSRMWDPEWKATYGRPYNSLVNALSYGLDGNRNKAMSVASGESYWWGRRGGQPQGMLARFDNMTPDQVVNRLQDWVLRMTRGETLDQILQALGDPVRRPIARLPTIPEGPDEPPLR